MSASCSEPEIHQRSVCANGLRFHVAECGDAERLALCLHGFPESSFSFRHQLPLLARLGYRAWAPDLRGYGGSARPLGIRQYGIDRLRDDVAGLIDASGATQILLMGHDWGGAIAWSFAQHPPRPIDRLIIMNVPHPSIVRAALRSPRHWRHFWYMLFFQLPWLPEQLLGMRNAAAIGHTFTLSAMDRTRFPDEVTQVYRRNATEPGALTAMLNYYRAMPLALRSGASVGSERITTPTLMLWGEAEPVFDKTLAEATSRHVRDLTLRFLPEVSHWVQQEAPETVNRMIEAWLAGEAVPYA